MRFFLFSLSVLALVMSAYVGQIILSEHAAANTFAARVLADVY